MRAHTPTKLSLWEFARILGFNPLHFAGIDLDEIAGAHCTRPMPQYEWQQGDRVGREAVARAIFDAESKMERALRFRLLPTWEAGERQTFRRPWNPELVNTGGLRTGGFRNSIALNNGYLLAGGIRQSTLLAAAATITWSVSGIWQIGTVTANVPTDTPACQVRAYYPGHQGDPRWEIRPTTVDVTAGVATITFPRECAVAEDLWEALEFEAADGELDQDFLAEVDIYRVSNDPSSQVNLLWEPTGYCGCGSSSCPQCGFQSQTGCITPIDGKLPLITTSPATWDEDAEVFRASSFALSRAPDGIEVSYYSGYQTTGPDVACPAKEMDRELATAVAYFAASLLERPPCDCMVDSWEYWREDPLQSARYSSQTNMTPFGTRRGMVWAWSTVEQYSLGDL